MNTTRNTIIDRVNILKGDMNQEDFGKIIGCGQSKVSELLNYKGTREFKPNEIVIIAQHFNVSTDYILGLTNEKTPSDPSKKKPLTAKKFCEMLLDLLDSSFPWRLIEVPCKETVISEFGTENEETFYYPAIYFKEYKGCSYQSYTDENGVEHYSLKTRNNDSSSKINSFIRKAAKYRKWLDDNNMDIDREEYEDFMEKQLSKMSE